MADPKPTQKQAAAKYAGNLGYFRRAHYLRSLRWWAFAVAVVGSLAAVITFRFWGTHEVFSTGPISENHARFARNCEVCHLEAERNPLAALTASAPGMLIRTSTATDVSLLDRACIQCHPTKDLHLPQADGLAMLPVASELNVVHATSCATCHREHVGHGRMPAAEPQTCVACHGDADELRRARRSLKLEAKPVAETGENRALADGLVRYLTPARPVGSLPAFKSYSAGHPAFAYERAGAKDPAILKFNHERHLRADIPAVQGRRLDCASCHRPGPGDVLFQPVRYATDCAGCHSLQIQADLPALRIPHGDPEKVRYFLASLSVSFEYALRAEGLTDPAQLEHRVNDEQQTLQQRGLRTLTDLENRVFFEGEPQQDRADRRPRSAVRKFLTECAKCHEVGPGGPSHAPLIVPPNLAERWVQRGAFTHLPHEHMNCLDCHGAARTSTLTSDILLPPQALCAECHRPASTAGELAPTPRNDPHALAAAQRARGGIKSDCTSCHGFHAPPDAQSIIEAIGARPKSPPQTPAHASVLYPAAPGPDKSGNL